MKSKFGKIAVTSALALCFACGIPALAGCDNKELEDIKTQNTTLTDENTTLKAEKNDLILKLNKETFAAVLNNVDNLGKDKYTPNDSSIRDWFLSTNGTLPLDRINSLSRSLDSVDKIELGKFYKVKVVNEQGAKNSLSPIAPWWESMDLYGFKLDYENGKYKVSMVMESEATYNMKMYMNWEVTYQNGEYKNFVYEDYFRAIGVNEHNPDQLYRYSQKVIYNLSSYNQTWTKVDYNGETGGATEQLTVNDLEAKFTQMKVDVAEVSADYTITITE